MRHGYIAVLVVVELLPYASIAGAAVCNVTVALSGVNDVRNCTWPTAPAGRFVVVNASWYFLGVVFPGTLRANEAALLLASGACVAMDSCVNATVAFANYTNITLQVNSSSMSVRYRSLRNSLIEEPLAAVEGNLSVAITNCSVTGPLLMIEGTGSEQVLNVSFFVSSSTVYCDDTMDIDYECFLLGLDHLSFVSGVLFSLESVSYTSLSRYASAFELVNVTLAHNVTAWMRASNITVEPFSRSTIVSASALVRLFFAALGGISGDFHVDVASSHVAVECGSNAVRPFLLRASSYLIRLEPLFRTSQLLILNYSSVVLRVADSQVQLAAVMRSVVVELREVNAVGTHLQIAVTNVSTALLADCTGTYSLDPSLLDIDGSREVAVVHLNFIECYRVGLTVSDVAVTASIVLDNVPNMSQALLGPLGGGDVLIVLTSVSWLVTVGGAVLSADVRVSRCSLDTEVTQTSTRPLAILSHASVTAGVFFSSSVAMDSLTLRIANCSVTRRMSVAVRPLTVLESAATQRFVEQLTSRSDRGAASGLGAFSSIAAVVVVSVTLVDSTVSSSEGISVVESQLVVPPKSFLNGTVGEYRAAVIVAAFGSLTLRLGQTNALMRQTFAMYLVDRDDERRARGFGLRVSIPRLVTVRNVSVCYNMSVVPNASIANNLSAQQVFLSAVMIVFNASIESSSVIVTDSRVVVDDAGASATAVAALVASELNRASLVLGAAASSVGYGGGAPSFAGPVIMMADTNVVNGSYVGLLPGYDYMVGCSDRVGCGAANAAGRFSLLSCTGEGSTLAGSVFDVSGLRVTTPLSLPSSNRVALVLFDGGVIVGTGMRLLARCSTWDSQPIATLSQVILVASATAVALMHVDYVCSVSPSQTALQILTTSAKHTTSDTHTASLFPLRNPASLTVLPSVSHLISASSATVEVPFTAIVSHSLPLRTSSTTLRIEVLSEAAAPAGGAQLSAAAGAAVSATSFASVRYGLSGQRLAFVARGARQQCSRASSSGGLDHPIDVDWLSSPTRLEIGSDAGAAHRGAVVGNVAVCVGALTAGAAAVLIVRRLRLRKNALLARVPVRYAVSIPVSVLLQPTFESSATLLLSGQALSAENACVGVAGLLGVGVVLVLAAQVLDPRRRCFRATAVALHHTFAPSSPSATVTEAGDMAGCSSQVARWHRWWSAERVAWRPRSGCETFVADWGFLFDETCERRHWWLLFDAALSLAIGALAVGASSSSSSACAVWKWAVVGVACAAVVLLIAAAPLNSPRATCISVAMASAIALIAVLGAAGADDDVVEVVTIGAAVLQWTSVTLELIANLRSCRRGHRPRSTADIVNRVDVVAARAKSSGCRFHVRGERTLGGYRLRGTVDEVVTCFDVVVPPTKSSDPRIRASAETRNGAFRWHVPCDKTVTNAAGTRTHRQGVALRTLITRICCAQHSKTMYLEGCDGIVSASDVQ